MDFRTFNIYLLISLFVSFSRICFGQTDDNNDYRKIESIDSRLEELKRSLQTMQRQAGYKQADQNIKKTSTPTINRPEVVTAKNKAIVPVVKNTPSIDNNISEETEPFESQEESTDALIKKISDRISSIEEITQTSASNVQDLNESQPLTLADSPKPSLVESDLRKGSAQRAYEELVERRREELKSLNESTAPPTENAPSINSNELPIRVSSVAPIFQTQGQSKTYTERKFPRTARLEMTRKKEIGNLDIDAKSFDTGNSFNFYYGFSIPNQSELRNYTLKFKNGHEFAIEYLRDFGNLSLGAGYSLKKFDTERWSQFEARGSNTFQSFSLTAGIEPKVNDLIFIRAKFSGGFTLRNQEILTSTIQDEFSETSFNYAIFTGLGLRWSDYFHSILYYKFDGTSKTPYLGHSSFHQFGIGFGIDF